MKKVKDKDFIKNYAICIKIFGFYKFWWKFISYPLKILNFN